MRVDLSPVCSLALDHSVCFRLGKNDKTPREHRMIREDMPEMNNLERIATFCGQCNCGCPELWIDAEAAEERRVVITDDFGQRIQMSIGQLDALILDVKAGVLDALVTAEA